MHALAPYLLIQYQKDLIQEAEIARRVKLASAGRSTVPAWRRALGGILASAARAVDPSTVDRSSKGRGARAMAA